MGTGGYIKVFKTFCITAHIEMSWDSLERINTLFQYKLGRTTTKERFLVLFLFLKKSNGLFLGCFCFQTVEKIQNLF